MGSSGRRARLAVICSLFVLIGVLALPIHSAHAFSILNIFGYEGLWEFVASLLALIASIALSVTSWFLALAGTLLNVSINITLHIKEIVKSTPAIYDVWKIIRDVSGLFIIFALLYAAIQLILGISRPNWGDLVKNIVVAGILINFSFFMTGVLIDASNVVSLALYRAMVPGQPDIGKIIDNAGSNVTAQVGARSQEIVNTLFKDGGISAVFMQSLQIQSTFDPKKFDLAEIDGGGAAAALKIILIAVTGIIIMITAGLSFLAASLAFIVRLFILIFLLAFSPILFAARIVPKIEEYGKDWWNMLKSQLIFMPVYLLLMYVALTVLTKTNVFNSGAYGGLWQGGTTSAVAPTEFIVLAINAAFVIIMLNIPLLAAVKLGGAATSFINMKKIGAANIWKNVGQFTGRNTLGATAAGFRDSSFARGLSRIDPRAGRLLNKGLTKVSSAGFGDKKASFDAVKKAKLESYNKLAQHAKYSETEAKKIATRSGALSRDSELENLKMVHSKIEREKSPDLIFNQNEYSRLGGLLATETDPIHRNTIETSMLAVQKKITKIQGEIDSAQKAVTSREKDIVKGIQESPQKKMAQTFEQLGSVRQRMTRMATGGIFGKATRGTTGKYNRDIADAIRKKKKAGQDIMDAIKKLDEKEPKP